MPDVAPHASPSNTPSSDVTSPGAWGPSAAGAPLVPAVLRGLADGVLAALAGVLVFATFPGRGSANAAVHAAVPPRRIRRLVIGLAALAPVLLALHLAAWIANTAPDHHVTSAWAAAALATTAGHVELWRAGLALLALWALGLARRPGLALVFAAAAVLVGGALGHPAALHPAIAIPAKALHLTAVALWLGGLVWLLAALAPNGPSNGPSNGPPDAAARGGLAREAGRVSTVALAGAIVVALTGVLQAWLFLPGPSALVHSAYGAVTLAKVVGFGVLVAFGAYHRYRVVPQLTEGGAPPAFAASLRQEVAVMVLVTLVGGLLAYVPTPMS